MSLLQNLKPTPTQHVKYADLASVTDPSTVTQAIGGLFEDVMEGRLSSARAFATIHAFTNRAAEHLAQQGLQLLLTPIGRELRTHSALQEPHTIHHINYLTRRAKENHTFGCDFVRTAQLRFESLVLEDGLLEKAGAAQRLIAKILECHEMIQEEPTNAVDVKIHYLTTNDLYYLFQAVNKLVNRLLCAFAEYTLPAEYEKQSYDVYVTFTEQCRQVVGLLKRTQLIFADDDRQFNYRHPSINSAKDIRLQIRDRKGPPRVAVHCTGHKSYCISPLFTLYEFGEVE